MADLKLDPLTGDLSIENGLEIHTDFAKESAQRINQALQINIAEWFANVLNGLPYIRNPEEGVGENLRYFFGNNFPDAARFIYVSLNKYIEEIPVVSKLVESSYGFNPETREFKYNFSVVISDGIELVMPQIDFNL